ncbi:MULTISPECIES: hypothetical protein [Alcanivorax]|uniref:hypothetical protein n=1 Tax=Alcanivorax TaxID=59753 RepID=UPI002356032F|nr:MULTISPECIES: hypothetical protein [Alcanivorax]MDF1638451.1 hypothetical protein [Alcanivorax jadensis]
MTEQVMPIVVSIVAGNTSLPEKPEPATLLPHQEAMIGGGDGDNSVLLGNG